MKKKLEKWAKYLIKNKYQTTKYRAIPSINLSALTFGNKGLVFEATVLFIDMRNSTKMLKKHNKSTIAKLYSIYFMTIVNIAKSNRGDVRSFNGDGALIFFEATRFDSFNNAVKTAREIRYALTDDNSEVKSQINTYNDIDFGIGIGHGEILCTKVGISGDENSKDLVWVGNAVNRAVKIADAQKLPKNIAITEEVYKKLNDANKYYASNPNGIIKFELWEESYMTYNDNAITYYKSDNSLEIT